MARKKRCRLAWKVTPQVSQLVNAIIEVNGKTYHLAPLRLADLAECEAQIKSRRRNPFDLVRPELANAPTLEDRKAPLVLLYEGQDRHLSGRRYLVPEVFRDR